MPLPRATAGAVAILLTRQLASPAATAIADFRKALERRAP